MPSMDGTAVNDGSAESDINLQRYLGGGEFRTEAYSDTLVLGIFANTLGLNRV